MIQFHNLSEAVLRPVGTETVIMVPSQSSEKFPVILLDGGILVFAIAMPSSVRNQ